MTDQTSLLTEQSLLEVIDPIDPKLARVVSAHATQSEKTSWKRKLSNLSAIIDNEINPLSAEIATLQDMLDDAFERSRVIREEMVDTCIHPIEFLVVQNDGCVLCKFCDKRMKVQNNG